MFKELEPEKIETLTNLLKQKYDEFTPEVISSIQSLGKGITFKDFVAYLLYIYMHKKSSYMQKVLYIFSVKVLF